MSEKFTETRRTNIKHQLALPAFDVGGYGSAYSDVRDLFTENAELRSKIERYNSQSALTISTLVVEKEKLEQQLAEAKRRIEYFEAKEVRDLAKAEFEKQQSDCREFTNRPTAQVEEV